MVTSKSFGFWNWNLWGPVTKGVSGVDRGPDAPWPTGPDEGKLLGLGQRVNGAQPFVELPGHGLAADAQKLEGVFVHLDLRIGRLHPNDKLLDVVRQAIDVIALAFKTQNGRIAR